MSGSTEQVAGTCPSATGSEPAIRSWHSERPPSAQSDHSHSPTKPSTVLQFYFIRILFWPVPHFLSRGSVSHKLGLVPGPRGCRHDLLLRMRQPAISQLCEHSSTIQGSSIILAPCSDRGYLFDQPFENVQKRWVIGFVNVTLVPKPGSSDFFAATVLSKPSIAGPDPRIRPEVA